MFVNSLIVVCVIVSNTFIFFSVATLSSVIYLIMHNDRP